MNANSYRFDGKRALVVGGATGMGAATAALVQDLGAEVVVMDYAEVTLPGVKAINLDLRDQGSIDAALDECGGRSKHCSPAPAQRTARPASRRSTSSDIVTSSTVPSLRDCSREDRPSA